MTALIVLSFFAFFIGLDWLLTRRAEAAVRATTTAPVRLPALDLDPLVEPVFVAGYELPEQYHYHRGHTWARVLSPDTVAIGLDDFARRLIGRAQAVKLPEVGEWLRQGAEAVQVEAGHGATPLLAPVDGRVLEVNTELQRRPTLCTDEPYRSGWLLKLKSPELALSLRNLLSGRLARKWMEDAREQIDLRLMALSGSVLADGGEPAHDFGDHLADDDWARLVNSFLLTEPQLANKA